MIIYSLISICFRVLCKTTMIMKTPWTWMTCRKRMFAMNVFKFLLYTIATFFWQANKSISCLYLCKVFLLFPSGLEIFPVYQNPILIPNFMSKGLGSTHNSTNFSHTSESKVGFNPQLNKLLTHF